MVPDRVEPSACLEGKSRRGLAEQARLSFDHWVRGLDPTRRRSTTTVASFAAVTLLGLSGMAVAAFIPGPREFFALNFWACLVPFAPTVGMGFPMAYFESRGRLSLRAFGVLSLLGSFFFQSFMWFLVVFSRLPGSAVMSAFPILLVSFHGQLYQSNIRAPFPLISSLCAFALALAFGFDADHLPILSIAGPMALGSHLLLGYYSRLDYAARLQRESLRAAVDAQILKDRTTEISQIALVLDDLRGRSHDAGNVVSGLRMNIPYFVDLLKKLDDQIQERTEAVELGEVIVTRLNRLLSLLTDAAESSRTNLPKALNVSPWQVCSDVVRDIKNIYPSVLFETTTYPGLKRLSIPFFGGEDALRRAVHNIVLNACEGDGNGSAATVIVSISWDAQTSEIVLRVTDDGPGFNEDVLKAPTDRIESTKHGSSGLGLYTTSRLLAANGGRLIRRNLADDRGASVALRLKSDFGIS